MKCLCCIVKGLDVYFWWCVRSCILVVCLVLSWVMLLVRICLVLRWLGFGWVIVYVVVSCIR